MVNPYTDIFSSDKDERVRTFGEDIHDMELIWHRDKCNREVAVLEGDGWKLQLDNQLPVIMEKGRLYRIPKMVYHRIIKGKGDLRLKIWDETN